MMRLYDRILWEAEVERRGATARELRFMRPVVNLALLAAGR